ncbi:MAG: hypothetical protein RMJ87_04920 [Cytophagales bacterium]|nr:hypothetical protein [Bernardetiaceae bacterium]MDW8204354.1 hypothetical protein [Cytophagales bacterium]
MKQISFWAAAHPAIARFLIGFSHIFLMMNALWLGFLLYATDVAVPPTLTIGLAMLFTIVYWCYPTKYYMAKFYTFAWRKTADALLVASHVFALSGYFNARCFWEEKQEYLAASHRVSFIQVANRAYEHVTSQPFVVAQVKQWRKVMRATLRTFKEEIKPIALGLKVLLIALSVLASLWLVLLITLLACHIACSGYEGLATVMLILGWAGVVFLAIWLIRLISRHPTKRKENAVAPQTNDR